jgi:signal transduction histidine kinase
MRPGFSDTTVERFQAYLTEDDAGRQAHGALDAFFAAASAALLLVDRDLRCVQVNRRFAGATGLTVDAHRRRALTDVLPSALEPRLIEVLRTGEPIDKVPLELRGRSFLASFFPVFGEDRTVSGLGGILIDVTEHRRLEAELRAAIEVRERVLAIVSHDLRNPLGTIQLAMSTLPDSARADPETARRIVIAERATRLMETLIGDLLDMATISTGTLQLQFADENADALIVEAIELYGPLANDQGIALIDDTQLSGVRLRCDRARLLQVLGNLCGNALKFCKRADTITLRGHGDERSLVLEIEDTGPGIPPADIPHLFERYWSTARGRQNGTGLGLFICQALVEAHGGRLTVASTVGVGTTFRIVLPLG